MRYWERWWIWHRGRGYAGMAGVPCGLDVEMIERWARREGLDVRQALMLLQRMDDALMTHAAERAAPPA